MRHYRIRTSNMKNTTQTAGVHVEQPDLQQDRWKKSHQNTAEMLVPYSPVIPFQLFIQEKRKPVPMKILLK